MTGPKAPRFDGVATGKRPVSRKLTEAEVVRAYYLHLDGMSWRAIQRLYFREYGQSWSDSVIRAAVNRRQNGIR